MSKELDVIGERIVEAVIYEFERECQFDDQGIQEMATLVRCCIVAAMVDSNEYSSVLLVDWMLECQTEYGGWLDCMRQAIEVSDLCFLNEHEEYCRVAILAAFQMARHWLFHLGQMRRGETLPITLH